MLEKSRSLMVSEIVFNLVSQRKEVEGYLDTFNNCRETGFVLKNFEKDICIWVYESRNSDSIVVLYGKNEDCNINNMFSEIVYNNNQKYFEFGDYEKASNYIINTLIRQDNTV